MALAALVAAGCGGGDETTGETTQGTPLSKSDFIAQADAICADATDEAAQAAEQRFGNTEPSDAEINSYIEEELVPNLEDQANQIDDLGPPDEDVDQVNAIVDALRSGIEELKSNPDILSSGDGTAFAEANKLADEYGLEECGASN